MKFAVVGCGKMGRRHADQYRRIQGAQIIGCYDAHEPSARSFAQDYAVQAYGTLDDLFSSPLDGVSICTPPSSHIELSAAAIARGVRVLCEKPLAARLDECHSLRPSALFASAFKFRHLAGAAPLREAIQRGELGRIVGIRGTAVSDLDMSDRWFSHPARSGGGVLIDNGVHLIDLCRYLMGDVGQVCASVTTSSRQLSVEESASIQLRLADGVVAHLLVSWEAPAPVPPLLEIYGTAGYARLGYELEVFDRSGKTRVLHVPADGVDIWREVIAGFVDFVGGRSEPSARFEDGWNALAIVDAAYRSLDSGRWEKPRALHAIDEHPVAASQPLPVGSLAGSSRREIRETASHGEHSSNPSREAARVRTGAPVR